MDVPERAPRGPGGNFGSFVADGWLLEGRSKKLTFSIRLKCPGGVREGSLATFLKKKRCYQKNRR